MGYDLAEINYFKAPTKDASAVVGYFAKGFNKLNSITISFKAQISTWDRINNWFDKGVVSGKVDSGIYDIYLDLKPVLEELLQVWSSLKKDFPVTLIGNAWGGAIATFMAVQLAEQYPQLKLTLITLNTSRAWNKEYASLVDRVVPNVYRWREADDVFYGNGESAHDKQTNEIWNVYGGYKCCPRPETQDCLERRHIIMDGQNFRGGYFDGVAMFTSNYCMNL
jgi:hypothetical protein